MLPSTSSKEEQFFCFHLWWYTMHQKFGHITCDTFRTQNNPGHSEKTSNPWLPHIDLLIDLWHSVLWACCCLGTNLHRSHTHTSNLNSAGLAVFSGNSNHTNSLAVMLHMLSSWGVWHLSTGWFRGNKYRCVYMSFETAFCHLCRFHAWPEVISSSFNYWKRLTSKRPEDSHVALCRISHSSDWLMVNLRCHRR